MQEVLSCIRKIYNIIILVNIEIKKSWSEYDQVGVPIGTIHIISHWLKKSIENCK